MRAQQSAESTGHFYQLKATPKTAVWGYYDAKTPPVLRIKSGDTVEIQTLVTSSPERFASAGVQPDQIEQPLRDIFKEVKDKGPGVHILTGPVYIEGAEPGDVLEVRIQKIQLAIPYALNAFAPGRGFLPDDYPYARARTIPLDAKRMIANFAPGIDIPLHPFFGSMGVAPPTSLIGTFQFIVRKDVHLLWPRAETPTHYITMGLHADLTEATKIAVREMINFLMSEKHLTREDAYMLASVAADLHITELVDGNDGVHMMIAKAIFATK